MHAATVKGRRGPPNKRVTHKLRAPSPRPPRSPKQWALFAVKWGAIGGLAGFAVGALSLAALFWIYASDSDLPNPSSLADYDPPKVTRVLAADGQVIGELYTQRRTYVPFERLPKVVVNAFVAAEDAGFWQHKGIDYTGMIRALLVNLRAGEHKQGGSTITQQVVKNFLLTPEKTFRRKFQEIILARRLESQLTKEEILTLYANQIYFGEGRYGVQEAARFYFGKNVEDLNVGEAAVLAGLPKAPNHYSPKREKNQEAAKNRQIYVLNQMVRSGYLSAEEAQEWIDAPIEIVADPYPLLGTAPEWVDMARRELVSRLGGEEELDRAGALVRTSVDLEVQALATEALRAGLRAYDERRGYGRPVRKVRPDKIDLEAAKLARRVPKGGPQPGQEYLAVVREVHDDGDEMVVDLGDYRASILLDREPGRYNPEGKPPSERFAPGDVVRVLAQGRAEQAGRSPAHGSREVLLAGGPEGAVVVLDPDTRRVIAAVGGYEPRIADFNRATMARRQAGSTFKPFVYAAAIDSGDFTPASMVNDAPEVYDLWKPENYKRGTFEGPVSLRHALAKSTNTVAIRVTYDVTPERVAAVARAMGIESELPQTLSLALGSGEVTPLELTNAFATLAAGGRAAPPQVVTEISSAGRSRSVDPPEGRQALRPEVAYVVLDMMRSVVQGGTAGAANKLRLDIAGKTGTSNESRDAWYVGVSPELAVGVWVGFDDFRRPLGSGETGGRTALPVYISVMEKLGKRSSRFSRPPGVVEARIDRRTGLLAHERARDDVYTEVFVDGTAPLETAPAPGEVDVADWILDQYDEGEGVSP